MTPERWQQIKEVLREALELAPERRPAFLGRACSSDPVLRQEVESLLSSSDEARSSFLRSSAVRVTTLPRGTKLGEYEVQTLLGSGGMGQVYRARDLRLGRNVAIKVLPSFLASDPDRLRRFEREARTVAALNHPNILAVFQMGTHEGAPYMVTELLEGETVREETRRGLLPQRKSLAYAVQVAHGLAAAHDKGVVHRDLKPENLFVTSDGRIKILDFGLARLVQRLTPGPSTQDTPSPVPHGRRVDEGVEDADAATASIDPEALTEPGVVMGTVGYMSPEQVRGEKADHRADIFSFGAILYEMLSAKRAFEGPSSADTMSAILNQDPPALSQIAPQTPPALQRIVNRCLEKRPERRFQSASDLGFALETLPGTAELPPAAAPHWALRSWVLAAGSVLAVAALLAFIFLLRPLPSPIQLHAPVRFSISLPGDDSIGEYLGPSVAFSPNGKQLAYVGNHGAERAIYVRSLDSFESVKVAETEGGSGPFFSPDGEWVGFIADGKLKKVPVSGGHAQALSDVAVAAGATWGPDDTIVYTPNFNVGLFAISARGGKPHRLTTPDTNHGEFHLLPEFLPDGRRVVFTIWTGGSFDQSRIAVLSLDTGKWRDVFEGGWEARYAPGQLVYVRGSTLLAVPFDWKRLRVVGPSAALVEGIWRNLYAGAAHFAVSGEGSLAYVPGTGSAPKRSLVWVSRSGERRVITGARNSYTAPRLSPDERRVAMWSVTDVVANIWIYDLARDTFIRLTFGADDHTVVWSPDGKLVAFESSRSGPHHQLYVQPADGTGTATQITRGEGDHYVCDWSPDGHHLAYVEWSLESGADLWAIDLSRQGQPRPIARTPFVEKQAAFSPNGRWIAFVSDESGQNEVYVQPFPGPGPKRQISNDGGEEPAWSRSGRELFYRRGGRMMAVTVHESSGELTADRPKLLFEGLFDYTICFSRTYDVAADGRFLMVAEPEKDYAARQINLVLDWPARLSQPRQ
jgi:eukaryotic-like serine/threonine-protein kinase